MMQSEECIENVPGRIHMILVVLACSLSGRPCRTWKQCKSYWNSRPRSEILLAELDTSAVEIQFFEPSQHVRYLSHSAFGIVNIDDTSRWAYY